MRGLLLLAALLLAFPSSALAQRECEEGRTRVDGRCCWPGQTFSAENARCEGAPLCPASLIEHGETCIARAVAPAPPSEPMRPPSTSDESLALTMGPQLAIPDAYGVSTREWPTHGETHPWRAMHVRGEDEGLIGAAFAVFEFGFLLGWLTALLDEQGHYCTSFSPSGGFRSSGCNGWALAIIPIGGGLAAGLTSFGATPNGSWRAFTYILGIPSVILQIAGLIGAIVAFSNSTDERGFQPIGDPHGVSLTVRIGAPETDAGLSLDLRF